jgi:hypothetical protein
VPAHHNLNSDALKSSKINFDPISVLPISGFFFPPAHHNLNNQQLKLKTVFESIACVFPAHHNLNNQQLKHALFGWVFRL